MQVELFPGVSTLLRAPDGSEIAIHDIEAVLHHQRAIVGSSPQVTGQNCLSVAEELLVIQRLQQHQDYLRTSGLSHAFASGTDGFGASLSSEIGGWDLGVFQENLRRGVEQIVRSIRQSRDPRERLLNQEYDENGPSRTPSQYAKQREHVNRVVSVLQDVYFFLSKRPTTSTGPSQPLNFTGSEGPAAPSQTTDTGTSFPNQTNENGQISYVPGSMHRNMPSSRPLNVVPMRSFTSSQALESHNTVPQPVESRSISYGFNNAFEPNYTDERRSKPSFSEEAVLKTQQLTEALKPKSLSRMESSSGLKWTRSLSRRKSKKKLSRTISNPHLVSTTQNLDNAIDLVNLPQSPAVATSAEAIGRSSINSGSSNNTFKGAQMMDQQPHAVGMTPPWLSSQSSHHLMFNDASSQQAGPIQETSSGIQADSGARISDHSNSNFASSMEALRVSDLSKEHLGRENNLAVISQTEPSPVSPLFPSSPHLTAPSGSRSPIFDQSWDKSTLSPPDNSMLASSGETVELRNTTTPQESSSNPAVRKSLLVNMGIQLPSPQVSSLTSPREGSPMLAQHASPMVPLQHSPLAPSQASPLAPTQASPMISPQPSPMMTTQPSPMPQPQPSPMAPANPSPLLQPQTNPMVSPQPSPLMPAQASPMIAPQASSSNPPGSSPIISTHSDNLDQFTTSPYHPSGFNTGSSDSKAALPIASAVSDLGASNSTHAEQSSQTGLTSEASFHTTEKFLDAPSRPRDEVISDKAPTGISQRESRVAGGVRESQTGEIITFPTEDDIDEDHSDAHTEVAHDRVPAGVPSLSTPVKPATKPSYQSTTTSPAGINPSVSYGESVYDMYMSKPADEDSLFKKSGIPSLRDDDPRGSRFVRMSRNLHRPMGDATSSPRVGRTDNPIWQVVAGLHDRSSVYSDLEGQSKRFSDSSALSRRDGEHEANSEDHALSEREDEHEANRALFKEARSAKPLMPVFADLDSIAFANETQTPHHSPNVNSSKSAPQRSETPTAVRAPGPAAPIIEMNEQGLPVQVVYYNDDELPDIMDQIAQGNSSARIEFRRRSAYVEEPTSAPEPQSPNTPQERSESHQPDNANKDGKGEEETQLAKVEQSILSLLRPTFASLKGFT